MAWTYNAAQLSTSDLYQVRFLIGDKNTSDQLLQDEEINFLLEQETSVYGAAVKACESISASFASQVDYSLGPHSVKASQRSKQYKDLALQIKKSSLSSVGVPLFTNPERTIFDIDMMNASSDCTSEEE